MEKKLKVSEIEQRTGLSRDTLRYYEREGLITVPTRNDSGFRMYTEQTLREVGFIKQAKELGFSLAQIRRARETLKTQGQLCPEFREELEARLHFYYQRIQEDRARIEHIRGIMKRFPEAEG